MSRARLPEDLQDVLRAGIQALGLTASEEQVRLLSAYLNELALWNPRLGLVRAEGIQLVTHHILDSLAAVPLIAAHAPSTLCDVGSGAGLPGIPLAIFFPHASVSLIERSARRCGFLRNVVALLQLSHVEVREEELRNVNSTFDAVTLRAFSPLVSSAKELLRVLAPEGRLFAYKGRRDSAEEEVRQVKELFSSMQIVQLSVPNLSAQRHMVVGVR